MLRAGADAVADEPAAEVLEQAGDPVVAAGAAAQADFDAPEFDREVVVDDDDPGGRHLVEIGERAERAPAVIHERRRLGEEAGASRRLLPAGDRRRETRLPSPREGMAGGQGIDHREAGIVPRLRVFASWIA